MGIDGITMVGAEGICGPVPDLGTVTGLCAAIGGAHGVSGGGSGGWNCAKGAIMCGIGGIIMGGIWGMAGGPGTEASARLGDLPFPFPRGLRPRGRGDFPREVLPL